MLRLPVNSLVPTILSLVPRFNVLFEKDCVEERGPGDRDHDQELRRAETTPRAVVSLDRSERRQPALREVVFD